MPASFFCSQSYNLFSHSPLQVSCIQNRKHPKKYIFQFVYVRPNFVALTQTENMLTREQIEEIHTERREMGIPTKRTLRRQHFYFFAIHLTRQSPFCGPPRHISMRDGTHLCPSSTANTSRHRSKAHRPARWFAGSSPNRHLPATHSQKRPLTATHPSREHGHLGRALRLYS